MKQHALKHATGLMLCLSTLLAGCGAAGEEGDFSPPPSSMAMGGSPIHGDPITSGSCDGDETLEKKCTVYVHQASGVTSCYSGIQFCDQGLWSECFSTDDLDRARGPE